MKRLLSLIVALVAAIAAPACANAAVSIFACEPEWASLAKEIGSQNVETFSATTARQDPHHVRAKPSLIAAMRKADLVICSGASLEIGWLPILVQKAGNSTTQPGAIGYLLAAEYVPVLEKPERLDRAEGDIHPEGNPHVHLNPHNIALVAKELTARLKALDPTHTGSYQANYEAFLQKWAEAITRWEKEAAGLKGMPVVAHHKSLSYLFAWLGLEEVGSLEPKPGIPPTPAHLESLLQTFKGHPARLIVRTPYDPADASEWLSQNTGAPAIMLPFTVGGDAESGDLFALFNRTIMLLKGATGA